MTRQVSLMFDADIRDTLEHEWLISNMGVLQLQLCGDCAYLW